MDSYSKKESTAIAGFAIIMMLGLHVFYIDSYRPTDFYFSLGEWDGDSIESHISIIGHLCVTIFAFNTGYVIYKFNELYRKAGYVISRICLLLFAYWMVCIAFLVYGMASGMAMPDDRTFIRNLFGFNLQSDGSFINVCYAWYVYYYIFLLLLAPLIVRVMKNSGRYLDSLILWLSVLIIPLFPFKIAVISWPLTASLIGFITCKYNIFLHIRTFFSKKSSLVTLFCAGLMFIAAWFGKYYLTFSTHINPWFRWRAFDGFCSFLVITSLLISINIFPKKFVYLLERIGTLGLFIWFLQSFFAIGPTEVRKFLFLPYFPPLILLWGILLTAIPSYFFQLIYDKFKQLFFFKSSQYSNSEKKNF